MPDEIQTLLWAVSWYSKSMRSAQFAPEALKLPVREGALLSASLWESIEAPFELAINFDDEVALKLAEARDLEIESGCVTAVSH
jgi:hypothetical protein